MKQLLLSWVLAALAKVDVDITPVKGKVRFTVKYGKKVLFDKVIKLS